MLKALALVPLLSTFVYAATFTVGVGKDETTGCVGWINGNLPGVVLTGYLLSGKRVKDSTLQRYTQPQAIPLCLNSGVVLTVLLVRFYFPAVSRISYADRVFLRIHVR